MSLIKKPEMTEANRAAHRANGSRSRGAVTPAGKARVEAANLRHGFYCQAPNQALTALGEDPRDFAALMEALQTDFAPSLECQLKEHIGYVLWRLKRAERVQNGMAGKRLRAAKEMHDARTMPAQLEAHENLERYEELAAALARRDGPTGAEIRSFVENFRQGADEEMKQFFDLLQSLEVPEAEPTAPAAGSEADEPANPETVNGERGAALRQAREQLKALMERYRRICVQVAEQLAEMQSPENLAALLAVRNEDALLMQRMQDSSLRQLWRLTRMLVHLCTAARAQKDVKNEGTSGDMYENTRAEKK